MLGESYWVASKLAEFIFCRLFRSITKQNAGGWEASTLIVRGITIVRGHCGIKLGGALGIFPSQSCGRIKSVIVGE